MIGAMPAVAVRHERRRNEKRTGRRPSQLPLQIGRPDTGEPTPSPDHHRLRNELYVCGKVAALHAVVGSLLLGIVVLVVGLVQLSPGAEAAQHRYYLMGAGAALTGVGVVSAILRCICLHWYNKKFREEAEEHEHQIAHKNGVSVVESGHHHGHKSDHKSDHDHKHDRHDHEHKGRNGVSVVESGHHHGHKSDHDHKHDRHDHEHKGRNGVSVVESGHHHGHKSDHKSDHDHKHNRHDHEHKGPDKPKLKAQSSVVAREADLTKQPSAASDA